jgi:hypothetical protein
VNNYYRNIKSPNGSSLNIPIEMSFDNTGREDGILQFERDVLKELLNGIDDFETTKFANSPYPTDTTKTDLNYEFNFLDPTKNITGATSSDWSSTYNNATFTDGELYFNSNSFKNSFFKIDLYDTKSTTNQRAYISVILPTQQGLTDTGALGPNLVTIKKPTFKLDYVGADKEGFFIYWLKERDYIDISEFYISAKFFNGKTGQFVRFMNEPQSIFNGTDKLNFDKSKYFYYKIKLDYSNYEYSIYKEDVQTNGSVILNRIGDSTTPIKWYEYINP